MVCIVAYVAGVLAALLAILGMVDIRTISLDSGLPTVAMTTPLLAVVVFWATARLFGVRMGPMRTFLFGGIAIYGLLYVCGRIVAYDLMSNNMATTFGAAALFGLAYQAIRMDRVIGR